MVGTDGTGTVPVTDVQAAAMITSLFDLSYPPFNADPPTAVAQLSIWASRAEFALRKIEAALDEQKVETTKSIDKSQMGQAVANRMFREEVG